MAITDIISEEEMRSPNMEIARGGPEDFMTVDEMDPYQDPEFQQLLQSLPMEQAEVLMQLIKEFKAMVAQGFQGEFEDFVKMKMASAQGGPEDFQTEDEMQMGPEELQSIIPMGQQVAQGGRIGYADGSNGMLEVDAYSALLKNVNAVYEKVGIPSAILQEHSDWENDKASRFETMKEYDAWLDTNYPRSPIGTYLYHLPKEEKMDILETISVNKAQGGRIGAFGGGVMGIGTPGMRLPGIPQMAPDGLEYNMKAGGFQNLGAQEGKDDVNAKLAKNEFVMTADAVRGAGGGNIEVGAQRMYDTMKQLEGKVA